MNKMVRKQVYLEQRQDELLKRLAEESGVTEAEIIRDAIDLRGLLVVEPHRDARAWQAERAFIESLIAQGPASGGL
jgi:hypothetical protein